MQTTAQIGERTVAIHLTPAAEAALERRSTPLVAEMELYFSCLLRKRVRFGDDAAGASGVSDTLAVRFRPVMTATCSVDDSADEPPVTDFPIANPQAFVPHWLRLDYRDNAWYGEFGYHSTAAQ